MDYFSLIFLDMWLGSYKNYNETEYQYSLVAKQTRQEISVLYRSNKLVQVFVSA